MATTTKHTALLPNLRPLSPLEVFEGGAKVEISNWLGDTLYGALSAPDKKSLRPQLEEYLRNFMIGLRARAEVEGVNFDAGKFEREIRTVLDLLRA